MTTAPKHGPPKGFFGELIDPATYKQLVYHALGLPLALLYFVTLVVAFSLGVGLLVVVVGVFVLAATLWLVHLFADIERALGTALLGVNLQRARRVRRTGSLRDWARRSLADAGTYKALLYLLLKLPYSLLVLVLGAALCGSAAALISAPFWSLSFPDHQLFQIDLGNQLYQLTPWSLLAVALAGVGLLILGLSLVNLLARAWAFLSVALLTDYGEGAQAQREVQALSLGAQSIAYSGDLAGTLTELLTQGVRATGARGALVLQAAGALPPDAGRTLAQAGLAAGFVEGFPATRAGLTLDLQASRAHLLRDWLAVQHPAQAPGTLLSLPIQPRGGAAAELHAIYPQGLEPSQRELEFWGATRDQAAVALEVARLVAQARTQGSEQERARLARELHDSVAQALYGIALGTRAARAQLARDPARAAENLDYAVQLADGATAEMKALLFALRPDALEEGGLSAALLRLAEMLQARYKLQASAEAPQEPELPVSHKGALYRIAQEAAHNAVKHARAGQVAIRLRAVTGAWLLLVQDDGAGFDPGAVAGGTLGLKSMRERAAEIGATLSLTSEPGAGTAITVRLPAAVEPPAAATDPGPAPAPVHQTVNLTKEERA